MDINSKIRYFDYFISRVIYTMFDNGQSVLNEVVMENVDKCRLNKLKLLKLLFFVSAKNVSGEYLLDDIFDNFYAMPYGPVESDVYNHINETPNYLIGTSDIALRTGKLLCLDLDRDICARIDNSVIAVNEINPKLFRMDTFDLVELSHKSDSWRIAFAEAQRQGKFSIQMPKEVIKSTTVYYK